MGFTDKQLTCADCKAEFTFSSTEQEFYATKGFTNEPKRCIPCRAVRKAQRDTGGDANRSPSWR